MSKIIMPKNVRFIIEKLENSGFEAYAVGGCVRDAVLGKEPHDWDITTSAMPAEVKKLFRRTIDTGIQHGTVTVMLEKEGYEVTTYRIDGDYEDGRHPKQVWFTRNLEEDLKRRDFTMNAMAYNDQRGIVDIFGGVDDLQNGIVRCVGNPVHRFEEDALRILRAVRFSATLDFRIEEGTCEAIRRLAPNLQKISRERIQAELEKLLLSSHPKRLRQAREMGITAVVFDEIDRLATLQVLEPVLALTEAMPKEHYLRWSAVLSRAGKERAVSILKGLKFDNKTVNIVGRIVAEKDRPLPGTRAQLRKDIYEVGEDIYEEYLEFMEVCLRMQMNGEGECLQENDGGQKKVRVAGKEQLSAGGSIGTPEWVRKEYGDILRQGDCISLKTMAVNGRDLIEAGLARGEQVGEELKRLLYLVLEDNSLNKREILLDMLQLPKE